MRANEETCRQGNSGSASLVAGGRSNEIHMLVTSMKLNPRIEPDGVTGLKVDY